MNVATAGSASVELNNLDDVTKLGGKLCILKSLAPAFTIRHPEFGPDKLVVNNNQADLFQYMDDGKCVAAVVMQDTIEAAWGGRYPTTVNTGDTEFLNHCDKMPVGEAVLSIPNTMPARAEYEAALSYMITKKVRANRCESIRCASTNTEHSVCHR